jgi:hypothetical protein
MGEKQKLAEARQLKDGEVETSAKLPENVQVYRRFHSRKPSS